MAKILDSEWEENRGACEERKNRFKQQDKDQSYRRICGDIKKRLNTTMIGALDRFEKEYADEIDKDEDRWKFVRKSILDNGNNQLRQLFVDLDNYEIVWHKPRIEFTRNDW